VGRTRALSPLAFREQLTALVRPGRGPDEVAKAFEPSAPTQMIRRYTMHTDKGKDGSVVAGILAPQFPTHSDRPGRSTCLVPSAISTVT
jgi:hypothetical protein